MNCYHKCTNPSNSPPSKEHNPRNGSLLETYVMPESEARLKEHHAINLSLSHQTKWTLAVTEDHADVNHPQRYRHCANANETRCRVTGVQPIFGATELMAAH